MSRIVFDIGGTHLRVARVDGVALADERRVSTPPKPDDAVEAFAELVGTVSKGEAPTKMVGGVPGIVSPKGEVLSSPNLPEWNGYPLAEKFSERFQVPTRVENDACLAALGEARYGAGKDARVVAYLGIGTGIGGARVVDGAIDRHAQGFEPGHQIVDVPARASLEALAGGHALGKKHGAPAESLPPGAYVDALPVLSAGIWNVIVFWSPDVVVLGGSLMNEQNGFRVADITRELEAMRRVLPTLPRIVHSALGDQSGLYGALVLASD